ncbi:MAG: hypothetical protein MUF45_09165 [Spirosomaceae bacterium]|nr:hypothetical protein [Spirosomataceae bacterium]
MRIIYLFIVFVAFNSCRNTDLNPYKEPEPGVHGYGEIKNNTFVEGRMSSSRVDFDFRWISLDKKINVNRVEFYVYFNEPFIDADGNAVTANHGGLEPAGGKTAPELAYAGLFNLETKRFSITANQIYNLYAAATFKYDKKTETIRWRLYGDNGLVYRSWSPAIESGEFSAGGNGANGSISFMVR